MFRPDSAGIRAEQESSLGFRHPNKPEQKLECAPSAGTEDMVELCSILQMWPAMRVG